MNEELVAAVKALEKEKGISAEVIFNAIEASLLAASKSHFGKSENVKVNMNRETGEYELTREFTVVREVEDPSCEITKEEAKARGQKLNLGQIFVEKFESKDFGRIASQNAKNVILQKLHEEERRSVYDQFNAKLNDIITGTVQRQNERGYSINLGKTDALLPREECVESENYLPNTRMKFYVLKVEETNRGPRILLSRKNPNIVRRLFEKEVPEIANGVVEIMAVAREAGSRTKMAVWTNDEEVDPIGACVGKNGTRINEIVDELCGEKIDIISWSDDPGELISNALSPSSVYAVACDPDTKEALVIVEDNQLSLAIGKLGQNARIVAKLTGYKIDIKSKSQAVELGLIEEINDIEQAAEEYEEEEYEEVEYEEIEYEEEDSEEEEETEE